ncbi:MAG: YeeE/YedE family protein [Nitrosomonas sp.]|nr:YeeE/YedE family protein [Nitrosomonas sp.]
MVNLDFIPWPALIGGMIIGFSASLLLLFNGRIAGVSGIVGELFRWQVSEVNWRIIFIVGLIVSPVVWQQFFALPVIHIEASGVMLAIAGLLVGFGARLGSGCTSGHGVCGLSRLSLRSLVAIMVFVITGAITVYLIRHVLTA